MGINGKIKYLFRLTLNAIPSQNLPLSSIPTVSNRGGSQREHRYAKRRKGETHAAGTDLTETLLPNAETEVPIANCFDEMAAAEALLQLTTASNIVQETVSKDFSVQVNIPKLQTVLDLIKCDKRLCSFTGLQNRELLTGIVSLVESVHCDTTQHR